VTSDVPNPDTETRSPGAIASGVPSSRYLAVPWRSVVLTLTVVTALFCAGVITGLSVTYARRSKARILEQEQLNALKAALAERPTDEALIATIHREDLAQRTRYAADRVVFRRGAYLLLAAGIALVLSAKWLVSFNPRGPRPVALSEQWQRPTTRATAHRGLIGLAGASALMTALVAAVLAWPFDPLPPTDWQQVLAGPPPAEPVYTDTWPRFRGPTGLGMAPPGDWPTEWNAATRTNVLWKIPIPGEGKGSPVVWGNRVFLTSADIKRRELHVICVNRTTGDILWKRTLKPAFDDWTPQDRQDFADGEDMLTDTGWAAPTPATDGERVYVTFATADIAAVDFDGHVVWQRNLGAPESMYGLASSLLVHKGLVIWQLDQGASADEQYSALLALDPKTGETAWRADRPVPNSWTTPIVVKVGESRELITAANPWVIAYDPDSGVELWRADVLYGDVAPSPVAADGVVFVTNDNAKTAAIRTGGTDNVTETNVLWDYEEGLPDTASPLCDGRRFLQADAGGLVTCLDAKTGTLIWEHEFPTGFDASPTLTPSSLVYLPDTSGRIHIFELADTFKARGAGDVGEPIAASPAFCDSRIYIRGSKHLFCIGERKSGKSRRTEDEP